MYPDLLNDNIMQVSYFNSLGRSICVVLISAYQKYLSPHKSFACAHRVLHQGESCSQYIKTVVAREGIKIAIKKSRERFQACKQASQILQARRLNSPFNLVSAISEEQQKNKRKYSNSIQCDNCTKDCINLGCDSVDCISFDCSGLDGSGMDCNFFDCGCGS